MQWNQTELKTQLDTATQQCFNAVSNISNALFFDRVNGKWSIAENMIHLEKVAKRIAGALSMPREQLANFGIADRPSRDFNDIMAEYKVALQGGVTAPRAFQALQSADDTSATILAEYLKTHAYLGTKIADFTEEELDKYQMPHPLLGLLTLREMLTFVSFHIGHHQKAVNRILRTHV